MDLEATENRTKENGVKDKLLKVWQFMKIGHIC